jgi:hypothetical protein
MFLEYECSSNAIVFFNADFALLNCVWGDKDSDFKFLKRDVLLLIYLYEFSELLIFI